MPYRILLVLIIVKIVFFLEPTKNGLKTSCPKQRRRSPFEMRNGQTRNRLVGMLWVWTTWVHTSPQCFTRKKRALLDGQHELMENQFHKPKLSSQKKKKKEEEEEEEEEEHTQVCSLMGKVFIVE